MNPLAYLRVAELLAGLAIVAGICWGVHEFLERERDIGRNEVRAEYAQNLAKEKDAARLRETELRAQRDDAINKGNEREQTINRMAASSAAASVGLRDTVAGISNSLSSYSTETLRSITSAYGVISAECAARRIEVAKDAEGRNSNVKTLIEAWPADTDKK